MDKMNDLNLIEQLSNANGPSGFENEVVAVVKRFLSPTLTADHDAMQNTIIQRKLDKPFFNKKPTLMLDAHLDAVGFIVQAIKPNGTIKFVPLGNWVPSNISAEKVRIRNQNGNWITGLVASKPPHFMTETERHKPVAIADLVIDVGTTSAKETQEQLQIDTGCPIVPDVKWQYFADRKMMLGKAFDNRIGTAALVATLNDLQEKELSVNLIGALAAQEEVGCRGVKVTVRRVKPQIAICIEGCPADDTFTPKWLIQTAYRGGPMLRDMDTSFIANPNFQNFAIEQAKALKIPFTRSVRTGGGIDGSEILTYQGIPTICIGIPVRYEHTNYGMVAYQDFKNTVLLLKRIISNLTIETISNF